MKVKLLTLLFMVMGFSASAQYENWGFRFPKGATRLSVLVPELSLESASKAGSSFTLAAGLLPSYDGNTVFFAPYLNTQYRYYFNTPGLAWLNDSEKPEGLYLHAGLYAYSVPLYEESGRMMLGGGPGLQYNMGKYVFMDVYVSPALSLVSTYDQFYLVPALTGAIRFGIDLSAFWDRE